MSDELWEKIDLFNHNQLFFGPRKDLLERWNWN